ncbi:MFS transporter [Sphingomonas prati]|uniref:ACS family hexuronate transporter-like MFS transporter n=1 Tax=Sphingomonas prati TaxID=1843237 RepID=A0A7W9BV04_9SPHN|nr:MFS transporter [Sphingomonas prati]MBB5730178.1 ACS family hexuronate transporter-like MFS transporter [Sphingomonas prati]GGE92145.1 MFS transporter [Sphingomonas prati]
MEQPVNGRRWAIVVLAFTAIMLNYVDRQVIALLKPMLQDEYGWSDRDYSHMASAFQFCAAVSFLGTGWFIDRIGLRRGFAIGVAAWSLAGMAHAFVSTVSGFIGVRALLGAAESIGTPAQVKTAATYFPPEQRSLMLGIGNMASNFGAVAAPLAIPPLALWLGWRAAFLITGGLGLVWVVVWLVVTPRTTRTPDGAVVDAPADAVPWGRMLRDRRQWAIVAAKALSDQCWWFLLFFMPDLFHRMFGLSQGQLGLPIAFIYFLAALGSLSGGLLPTWLLRRGVPMNRARKGSMLLYAILILPVPAVLLTDDAWVAAGLLGLGLFAHQGFSTNVFGMTADIFPARMIGTAIGIGAFAGNLSGMAMIEAAGFSLDNGYGYGPLLMVCGGSYLVALLLVHLLVPRLTLAEPGSFRTVPTGH